ncbi:LOW QUALITY PROTEIN: hypothetical protein YC2023_015201 [Brassica napus]
MNGRLSFRFGRRREMVMERQDEILPLLCVCFHFTQNETEFWFCSNDNKLNSTLLRSVTLNSVSSFSLCNGSQFLNDGTKRSTKVDRQQNRCCFLVLQNVLKTSKQHLVLSRK